MQTHNTEKKASHLDHKYTIQGIMGACWSKNPTPVEEMKRKEGGYFKEDEPAVCCSPFQSSSAFGVK